MLGSDSNNFSAENGQHTNGYDNPFWRALHQWDVLEQTELQTIGLNEPSSMTAKLTAWMNTPPSVNLLHHGLSRPWPDEVAYMPELAAGDVIVREVLLHHENSMWMLGRTSIPVGLITEKAMVLKTLGSQPIGHYLFAEPNLKRSAFEFARVSAQHQLYQLAAKHDVAEQSVLWARRSQLVFHETPLLLSELFLPAYVNHAK